MDTLPEGLQMAMRDFKAMRKQIKSPMTDRAVQLLLNNLEKLAPGDEDMQVAILEQSIANSWKGVYQLQNQGERRKPIERDYNAMPEGWV